MPTNFVMGQILMLLASREVRSRPQKIFTFPFVCAMSYSLFVFIPVACWYFYQHTGWSTAYLRPEKDIVFWAGPFIFSMYALGMFLGAWLAQLLIQRDQKKFVFLSLALGLLWLAGVWGLTSDEYFHVGTFAQYHAGEAVPLFEDAVFQKELNQMGALMFAPLAILAVVLAVRSRRLA